MTIRDYAPADWQRVTEVHDAARLGELAASVGVEAFLTLEQTYEGEGLFDGDLWVAELDGRVVGFLAFSDAEVTWMYVDPACHRRGVGRALLRHALERAGAEVELTVLDGNDAARALYESEGFVVTSTTTGRLVGNEAFTATGHEMHWYRERTVS
ncbi:GNAT family N-acetyltransferase [Modestobacter sp. I12A-02628]|uniref:GNAT family N-acetyltransferase n=1 Tax=Goekera deserti TaxID=2497753 RepID=A0A7K3WCK9_9ACTN|nr:GNAT family N-acetyltransferase [Goekera deserti]NDI48317.1 GNAT family N-acetyltransferase [Goekera deserti]NEL54066.1 GNAT family N-acetyltransferase [Goekera deserti]